MMKRRSILAGALIGTLAALALLLIWLSGDKGPDNGVNKTIRESQQSERVDATPVQEAEETEQQDSQTESSEMTSESINAAVDTDIPYDFRTWEDALNYYAELVGKQYDIVKTTMTPPSPPEGIDPELYALGVKGWFQSMAAAIVFDRVFVNGENPRLEAAMKPFLGEMPLHSFAPDNLLIRAGRIPESVLYQEIELPNGEIYSLKRGKFLVVKYRREGTPAKERLQRIAKQEARELDLLQRMSEGPSESEASKLNKELTEVQRNLETLRTPIYVNWTMQVGTGKPDHPDYEVLDLNLGTLPSTNEVEE